DHLVAALAALERLAVDRAQLVHDDEVALRGRLLDRLQSRGALAQRLELGVDARRVDLGLAAAELQALVVAELGGRAHADLEVELQRLALLGRDLRLHANTRLGQVGDGRPHRRRTIPSAVVRSPRTRFAAWLYTGPLGHLYAGVADWLTLLSRYWWARVSGRARRRRAPAG